MVDLFRLVVLKSNMVPPELILLDLSLVAISAARSLALMALMPFFASGSPSSILSAFLRVSLYFFLCALLL